MGIVEISGYLSAFAAFMTACLAITELVVRNKAKKAEEAIEVYANFLFVCQQIDYIVGSAESFTEKCATIDKKERRSYAKTHLPDPVLTALIHDIEKDSISNFKFASSKGRLNSMIILEFTRAALHTLVTANIFYQTVVEQKRYPINSIKRNYANLKAAHDELVLVTKDARNMLRQQLKKTHSSSNAYLISLGTACVIFFAISFLLQLL